MGKYDLFKFLRIGDAHFSENIQSELHKNEIINLYRDSWVVKTRQYTHLECIPKGARTRCNWQIPEKQIYHAN